MTTKREIIEKTKQSAEGIAKLAKDLGYSERWNQLVFPNGASATNLIEFLDDNPGACEAIINWVIDNGCFRDGSEIPEDDEEEELDNEDS